jgi:dTMP kinase
MNRLLKSHSKGAFITFEGCEGGGKSTVLDALHDSLISEGYLVLKTREPGGVFLSEKIRAILLESSKNVLDKKAELLLFLAARAQHVEELIKPLLNQGYIILCDRFNDSSVAYQGIARGLGEDLVDTIANFASSNLQPDCTFLLDIDPRIGLERTLKLGSFDRIENETLAFHENVRKAYLKLANQSPSRIKILDASLDKDKVIEEAHLMLWSVLERIFSKTC